jgi:CheY-like chemotaxis protein
MSDPRPEVLVVDDDDDIRETIAMVLDASGYATIPAFDGVDALEQLRKEESHPSLILLDLRMPRLSGEEVMQELMGTPALAGIPVVVMSGDREARETALAMGAVSCLTKPIEIDDLESVVSSYARPCGQQSSVLQARRLWHNRRR